MRILGVDLGQSKSAWETLDTQTGEVRTGTVRMEDDLWRKLLMRTQPDQLVIERGPLAARVHDLARVAGVSVLVADTTQDAWQWKNVKRKTDADDAGPPGRPWPTGKLVRLAALGQINPGTGCTSRRRPCASGGTCWNIAKRWWPSRPAARIAFGPR